MSYTHNIKIATIVKGTSWMKTKLCISITRGHECRQ